MVSLQLLCEFDEDSYERKVIHLSELIDQEKLEKQLLKEKIAELNEKTIEFIETISDEDAKTILEMKWTLPLISQIFSAPNTVLCSFADLIENLATKYIETADDIEDKIRIAEKELTNLLNELSGDEFDMIGIAGLKKLLGGE